MRQQEGVDSKGKDFLSRTKAFVDIVGINRESDDEPIPYVKRAVLLRSLILRYQGVADRGQELQISDRVLDAFLDEERYEHDARSMEAIVSSSELCAGSPFNAACIVNNCLELHVSPRFNMRLKGELSFSGQLSLD